MTLHLIMKIPSTISREHGKLYKFRRIQQYIKTSMDSFLKVTYLIFIVVFYIRVSSKGAYAMANLSPPVRTCVLRVGIKCCKGCQTKAKRKLLNVSGVSTVEYNAEQGLLTVTGDANPTTLLHKLTKWGKKAELVSFLGDNYSSHVPRTPEQNQNKTMEKKKKKPTKCCLLMCFGNKRSKNTKIEPMAIPNWQYRGLGNENGNARPFINAAMSPPMVYPPPQAVPGFTTPIPYPPPSFFPGRPPPYTGAGMFQSAPPQSPPYFPVPNPRLHYPHH
ncbi:unnamed protein product [Arabidopsis thaliana]|uniref:HMA domain-containing protein n=1 Tax=Arabidopsis thaliana TaxID=3702 RepID=A0A654FS61_ARATH|nr:unnamed protein product [Arabidopsis thaliana]